ncbi:MAG: DUF5596 domain-containing protein [Christensenellaceae bacterium]|nr:DUF5596 domain-containing protein [Christensenellaceae bacterium]
MILETLMSELHYIRDIEQAVLQKIRKDEKLINEIAETAYHGEDFDFALCKRMPLTRLTIVTYLLLRKYDEYKAKGIPDSIIFDTFRDVSLRAKLYYKKTGRVGITKGDVIWFRHIMNVVIFKIGALQFQPFEMIYLDEETIGEPYITFTKEQKVALPAGAPVINCHIQENADLSPQSVKASFQSAKRFFSAHFPAVQYKAFLCYSWLLYPPMVKNLSQRSNIKQFAANFSVIGSCNDSKQATEYLFGHETGKVLPANATSLQELAFEHIELFGFACGIIPI